MPRVSADADNSVAVIRRRISMGIKSLRMSVLDDLLSSKRTILRPSFSFPVLYKEHLVSRMVETLI